MSAGPCPQENSKTAKWLWKTVIVKDDPEVTLDTPEVEGETLEELTV